MGIFFQVQLGYICLCSYTYHGPTLLITHNIKSPIVSNPSTIQIFESLSRSVNYDTCMIRSVFVYKCVILYLFITSHRTLPNMVIVICDLNRYIINGSNKWEALENSTKKTCLNDLIYNLLWYTIQCFNFSGNNRL